MSKISSLARPNIVSMTPYSSARDEYSGEEAIFLDANENPYGTINRYPDPLQKKLKDRISKLKDVEPENIFLGNGSDEAIDLLFRIFCVPGKDKVLTFTPTYGMYEVCSRINDAEMISLPLNDDFDIPDNAVEQIMRIDSLKAIVICTPNNPTGNSLNTSSITKIIENFSGIVIIDEAYCDFSQNQSWTKQLKKYANLVILQTFSKAWGIAAARVGMAFADKEIISLLNKVKYPYNISLLNQKAALETLERKTEVEEKVKRVLEQRSIMKRKLAELNMVEKVFNSDANFLLIKVNNADKLYKELVRMGIIVRNRSSVVMNCLRITIGTEEENEILYKTLKQLDEQ